MCYLVYTNFQRQGAVVNMTMRELRSTENKNEFKVVSVWGHKTATSHGSARIVMPVNIYKIIIDQSPPGEDTNLVFTTAAEGKVTHIGAELTKLGDSFGKKFAVSVNLRVELLLSLATNCCRLHPP